MTSKLDGNVEDIISMIFVLSANYPDKFKETLLTCLVPAAERMVLVYDLGLYNMAILRFSLWMEWITAVCISGWYKVVRNLWFGSHAGLLAVL